VHRAVFAFACPNKHLKELKARKAPSKIKSKRLLKHERYQTLYYVINVRIRTVSQTEWQPRSVPGPLNRLDLTNPAHTVGGSDHPIISKNQSRSNRGHWVVISRHNDVTFNAEILHHGRDVIRAQFEQGQPPEYALTAGKNTYNRCLLTTRSGIHDL
jgi:hypothetical protein